MIGIRGRELRQLEGREVREEYAWLELWHTYFVNSGESRIMDCGKYRLFRRGFLVKEQPYDSCLPSF